MAKTISQEERQLIKLVEKMPLAAEDKNPFIERIRNGEMSKELAEEIRQKLVTPVEGAHDNDQATANRNRNLVELSTLVKRWQLSSQAHNFGKK